MTINLCSCPSPHVHREASPSCSSVTLTKAPMYEGRHRDPNNARRMAPTARIAASFLVRGA